MSTKPPSDYAAATTAYYDANAVAFCANTAAVDMSELYTSFLQAISAGARILDLGCGSGRDSLAFLQKGYRVVSTDASAEMVRAATKLTGQESRLLAFDELNFDNEFDGIWACASLLHVARRDMNAALARITKALKPGGILYLSFKYGDAERFENGRFFNDLNEMVLGKVLASHPQLELARVWKTEDARTDRLGRQPWLNAIVCRHGTSICDDLLCPERLWTRKEILTKPLPVPKGPGVYGWYFRSVSDSS